MNQPQQRRKNGHNSQPNRRPQDQLDLYQDVVDSTAVDPFLDEQNLGLGNYTSNEMWQQVESYKNGLYAAAGFRRLLTDRAKSETETQLAIDGWEVAINGQKYRWPGWDDLSDDERREIWYGEGDKDALAHSDDERFDRRRWIDRRGDRVLTELYELRDEETATYPAIEALKTLSGWEEQWEPAHNRMMMMRHEASRSRSAQLLDNVFGRVKREVQEVKEGLRR